MKLHLGCHDRIKPGYVNVDKDKYPGVDMTGDVFKLGMGDGCADEIYASHILEHAHHTKTLEVLKDWNRILKDGGILKLAVPDFKRTIEIYLKCGLQDWVINYLYGDQIYDGAFHYSAFDEARITDLLKKAGFREMSRVENLPGASKGECSTNVSNIDGKSVSLNIVAIK